MQPISASTTGALPDRQPVCDLCGRPLKVIELEVFGKVRRCTCYGSCGCAASRARIEEGSRPRSRSEGYRRAGIPERYAFDEVSPEEATQVDRLAGRLANGGWAYVHGPNGTGKTRLAALAARRAVDSGCGVRFVTARDLVESSYGDRQSLALLKTCPALVVDDLGKEHPSQWSVGALFDVVDARYEARRSLLVTSNYRLSELAARMSADESAARAIASRLAGECEMVEVSGRDMRLGG